MSPSTAHLTPAQVLEARRRKVRKGTHSCWECRRRKIRCQYVSPDDDICIGCRSRGSSCRSQEFADEAPTPPQVPEKKVSQRLDRLESMMEQLMAHVLTTPTAPAASAPETNNTRRSSKHTTQATAQAQQNPSSSATSEADSSAASISQCGVDVSYFHDEASALERMHQVYHDPAQVVAQVCPSAAGKQGYGVVDVLDTSTADDTPVAALLGIQDSLSQGGSTPIVPPVSTSPALCPASDAATSPKPNSVSASVNSGTSPANGGSIGTGGLPGGSHDGTTSADSDTTATSITADKLNDDRTRHLHLSKLLHSLFPTQDDIDTITTGAPAEYVASLFHSKQDIALGRSDPPSKMREIPPMTSHPAVLARRLLQITLCMQQLAPCFVVQNKLHMTDSVSDVINRIAGVVGHTVTANDELIGSVEGLECLVLLGQQQSNAGQLRKAWLTYRRAMSLAQLMGIDRGNTRALKSYDPTSDPRMRPTPAAMWFRINACDRYVSLLLGLRAGSQGDDVFLGTGGNSGVGSSTSQDDTDTPVEKLEKAHTVLTGRIIERNHSKMSHEESYAVTKAIDADLRAAASRNLSSTWWEVPSYDPYVQPEFIFKEMARSILQVHHHCILILLHLPYMLRGDHPASVAAKIMAASSSASTAACERGSLKAPGEPLDEAHSCKGGLAYSKATCMQSSRAVLQRFIQFRTANNSAFSCRHVDYASLIAAMTLIVGYLGPRPAATSDPDILYNFDSQLRKDHAMIQQVRERMEHVGKINKDKLSRESAATIQQLLPVLDLVARKPEDISTTMTDAPPPRTNNGSKPVPSTSGHPSFQPPSTSYDAVHPSGGRLHDVGDVSPGTSFMPPVRLNVPYFGTVNIHANAAGSSGIPLQYQQPLQQQTPSPFGSMAVPVSYDLFSSQSAGQTALDWNAVQIQEQGAAQQQQDSVDLNAMLVDFDPIPMGGEGAGGNDAPNNDGHWGSSSFLGFGGAPAFPDMTGSTDDWVMQGVDTTYWSLLNGGGGSFGGQMG